MKKYAWIMILTVLLVFGNIGMARAEIIPPQGPGQIGGIVPGAYDTQGAGF